MHLPSTSSENGNAVGFVSLLLFLKSPVRERFFAKSGRGGGRCPRSGRDRLPKAR